MTDDRDPSALDVRDNPEARRFEALLDGRVVAFTDYRQVGGRLLLLHTETEEALEGQGIGSTLVQGMLDELRSRGATVTVKCPFVQAWIKRHPAYRDLVRGPG